MIPIFVLSFFKNSIILVKMETKVTLVPSFHYRVIDEYQITENEAAIKIQSWFRSLQIQKLIT